MNLLHYGTLRRSGRYPWGSGKDPFQSGGTFLPEYEKLKAKGYSETQIAKELGINTRELRDNITWARKAQKEMLIEQVSKMRESGMTNTEIGKQLNISEGTVRNYQSNKEKNTKKQIDNVQDAVIKGVDNTGYLDVGVGVERQLGVSRNKFNTVVNKLEEDGYYIHEIYVKRLNDPSKYTTIKVLTKDPDVISVKKNSDKIRPLDSWSDDGGITIHNLDTPAMVDLNRIKIRYGPDGGTDKDGLIELRPGTKDLDLGGSTYAQVRIGAGKDRFLKGMAMYTDSNFPDGVDIIYNTNKPKDVAKIDVLKKMKSDIDNPFGANITRQNKSRVLNIVNEEGEWDTWSTSLSSQFLSKQPTKLIKDRLEATRKSLQADYDEINELTNPIVKEYLMKAYSDGLDSKARSLKAQGLPRTKSHVILPYPDMKPNEVYAPNYKNGETVVLVRYPHGGVFEIPELVVNNRSPKPRKSLGNAPDAIGIHPSVASKMSGADFDGDTAYVIPNNKRQIKTSRSLKELRNFEPNIYKVPPDSPKNIMKRNKQTGKMENTGKTIKSRTKQIEMGKVSNLITDMTIKGASQSEIARAVRHSMVVIDSEKHNLDYKQSAIDNGINALKKKYLTHINPETGKTSRAASTLISRSKKKIDISDPNFDVKKYTSGTAVEDIYGEYVSQVQSLKNRSEKTVSTIKYPKYSKDAAKVYKNEIDSLNKKLNIALLNAPKERQAQILSNKLYYDNLTPEMYDDKDKKKKLKGRSIARARTTVGANKTLIDISPKEWEAIQSSAISKTKLKKILDNTDMDKVKKLATPRQSKLGSAKMQRAKQLLSNGYTYAEVSTQLGVSVSTIRKELVDDSN